jgi:hypothetical protein
VNLNTGEHLTGQEVFLTPTLVQRPVKISIFIAIITNELILGLEILRAYDAFVEIGRQTLRLAGEELSIWRPGFQAHNDQKSGDTCTKRRSKDG